MNTRTDVTVADIMIDILMENLGNETIRDDLEVSERFFNSN